MTTSTEVTAPDGRDYHVAVEWLPHGRRVFRRLRRRKDDIDLSNADVGGLDFGDELVGVAIAVGVLVLIVLFWWLLLPLLFVLLDLLLIALLVIGGVVLKVVFRRPWTVAVRADGYDTVLAKGGVVGWKAATRARDAVAAAIKSGSDPQSAIRQSNLLPV